LARRGRPPRPASQAPERAEQDSSGGSGNGVEPSSASDLPGTGEENEPNAASVTDAAGQGVLPMETSFSDRFQRSLLNSGLLHTSHGSLLDLSIGSLMSAFATVLWLVHVRRLAAGDFRAFYEGISPVDLFVAYGAPGTSDRMLAISADLLLLWYCGERLFDISSLLHVATLTLRQRNASLAFVREHPPPSLPKENEANTKDTMLRIGESVRCSEFALELSDIRWLMLQEPVMVVYNASLFLFLVSFILLLLPMSSNFQTKRLQGYLESASPFLDPLVPLTVGLCGIWPLMTTLLAGHWANFEARRQRMWLRSEADAALSAAPGGLEDHDVQYVQLRVKATEALQYPQISWPNGRELGIWEPVLLVMAASCAAGFAVMRGASVILP